MSFIVEIPSVFNKSTQIPNRLGNTTLTGNETIHGSLNVGGPLTLDGTNNITDKFTSNIPVIFNDTTNMLDVSGQNMDLSGNLSVAGVTAQFGGNITSPNWNVLRPVYNLTNRFSSSSGTQSTVATNVVITGNFILHFYNSGFRTSGGLGRFQLYAVPNAGGSNILIGDLKQYFNTNYFILSFSQSNYVENVPAGTYSLLLTRNNTSTRHDNNNFLTIIMQMVPF